MFGLSTIDIIVIAVYFSVMIAIGFWSMMRIKSQEDFFMGGRGFGKIIQIFANFGQATSSDTGPSVATTTFNNGASGVWANLLLLFTTPFYWFIAPWYRRLRCMSLSDFFYDRYASKSLSGAYAIISSIGLCILLSLGFITITKTTMVMTPKTLTELTVQEHQEYDRALRWEELETKHVANLTVMEQEELSQLRAENPKRNFSHLNKFWLIFSIVVIVCLYSVAGGLEAAFISDMIQGVFIILLSVILIPFSIKQINLLYGGEGVMNAFGTLHQRLPASFFEIFGSPNTIDFTWYYIAAVSLMSLINVSAQANTFVTPASAKNEYTARFGMTFGMYLKRFTTVLWGLTALFAVLLFGSQINDPDILWGFASRELLGPLNCGLIGLMIASLMAALMSTADMMMITTSGLLTRSVYSQLVKGKSDKHYVNIGRTLGSFVVIGAAFMTMANDSLFGVMKLWWEFGVIFSAGFWMGILWKKTNRKAVWISMASTFSVFFLLPILITAINPDLRTNDFLLQRTVERKIEREYVATEIDVDQRTADINDWKKLNNNGVVHSQCPQKLAVGETFTKSYVIPQKTIFWSQGINMNDDGLLQGKGLISLELVLLNKMGFHLEDNKYAFNETIRVLIRTIFPFLIIFIFSYVFSHKKDEEEAMAKFYVKMKTPVHTNPIEDDKEMVLSYAKPDRFDHLKLFGEKSNWQFMKWDKTDIMGFAINLGIVIFIILTFYVITNIGS